MSAAPGPAPARALGGGTSPTGWPGEGVVRLHYDPAALPQLGDEPGSNRFDDPRPRTIERFLIRYAGTTLRGCLLEVLAHLRPNSEAQEREEAVDVDDHDLVEPPESPDWQHIADFLDGRKVARIHATHPVVASVNDPVLLQELNIEPGVRAVLDSEQARAALLEPGSRRVHLDNSAIRLATAVGRLITQACALALYDRPDPPGVIHYRSRHDDAEDCWAIYDHQSVDFDEAVELSSKNDEHLAALRSVGALWRLPLPPEWT